VKAGYPEKCLSMTLLTNEHFSDTIVKSAQKTRIAKVESLD
jgi:hypothetical protein